jgi:hypothetical protein
MELTILKMLSKWVVANKEPVYTKIVYIECDEADEAMAILQELNGKPYGVIDEFHRTRQRLG